MVILLLASTAIVVMVINLAHLIRRRATYKRLSEPRDDQFWKALKQLLQLVAFPVLFIILELPVLVYHVYVAINSTRNEAVLILPPHSLFSVEYVFGRITYNSYFCGSHACMCVAAGLNIIIMP